MHFVHIQGAQINIKGLLPGCHLTKRLKGAHRHLGFYVYLCNLYIGIQLNGEITAKFYEMKIEIGKSVRYFQIS